MKRLIAILALVLAASCAAPATHGVVTSRTYEAAHDEPYQVCTFSGKYGCWVYMTLYSHVPDRYTITFEGRNGDGDLNDFDTDVDVDTYNACLVGSGFVDADKDSAHCVAR